jgi:pimeloyl-ACP methyl ester carboxylesterase
MWVPQIAVLAKEYRVLAPDLRGFGQSPLAASDDEADQIAARGMEMHQYADDLAAFLDALQLEEPVVFVGFSMGGYIAWQFWKRHGRRVRALVLCDTRAVADAEDARKGRLEMAEHVGQWGSGRVAEVMLPKLFATDSITHKPQLVEATRRVIESTDPRAIAAAQRGMASRPDVTAWLCEIDVPTLVLVGDEDAISRVEEMQSIAKNLPRADFHVIPGAGHMTPVENAKQVNATMAKFLRSLES